MATIAFVDNDTLRLFDVKERKSSKSLVLGIAGSLTTYLKPRQEDYPAFTPDYLKKGTKITNAALEVTSIAFSSDSANLIVVATGSGSSRLERAHALMVVNVSRNTKDVPLARRLGQSSNCRVSARFVALSSNNVLAIAEDFLALSPDGDLLTAGRKTGQICLSDIAPHLKLSSSAPANASDARNITVKIEVTEASPDEKHTQRGSGAQDVRLFRNGSLIKVWRGNVLRERNSVSLEVVVPIVAGENRIAAYAFNRDNIKSSDATLIINGADSLKRVGVAYVFSVGVNEYANSQYDLKYAVADAKDFC